MSTKYASPVAAKKEEAIDRAKAHEERAAQACWKKLSPAERARYDGLVKRELAEHLAEDGRDRTRRSRVSTRKRRAARKGRR